MRKTYIINLNPDENPKQGYLRYGGLVNPFPVVANVSPSGHGLVRSPLFIVKAIEKHIKYGISLEQAKELLPNLLSQEAIGYILKDHKEGDRLEVVVDSDAMKLGIRELTLKEYRSLVK